MPVPRLISPMLDGFVVGEPISDHHGVRCCPAMTKDTNQRYLLKIIRVPASQVQLDALLLTGAYPDEASALSYFRQICEDICKEAQVLTDLSAKEGFFAHEKIQVVEMDDGIGYEVYLLSPYKRTLERFFRKETVTHLNAVNLGLDLCAALTVCREAGYLYADLKPENVYVTPEGRFRIGDLGFLPLKGLKYASLPDKYRSAYTAPEVEDAYSTVNTTIDIFAAGLILYQAYNGGILPENLNGGATLPPPIFADYEMAEIILKACEYDPSLRWQDPKQMGQSLVSYMQRNGANDTPIVPASVTLAAPVESPFAAPEEESTPSEQEAQDAQIDAIIEQIRLDAFADSQEQPAEDAPADEPVEAAEAAADEPADTEEDTANETLSFLDSLASDDTTPEADPAQEADYDDVSEEVEDILSQADALIAHELPDPVVAPEPIAVAVPVMIEEEASDAEAATADPEKDEEAPEAPAEDTSEEAQAPEEAAAASDSEEDALPVDLTFEEKDTTEPEENAEAESQQPAEEGDEDEEEYDDAPPKVSKKAIGIILALIILAGLIFGGYAFYRHYYVQTIHDLTLDGDNTKLTVHVTSTIDESLLTVVCSDAYGNVFTKPLVDGIAVFEELKPDTLYSVKVEISGLHKLDGQIEDSYSTPDELSVTDMNISTGTDAGSAVVSFTASGSEVSNWKLTYSASGEEAATHTFTGSSTTVTGLALGKTYTFTLSTQDGTAISGKTQVTYTVIEPIVAENVRVNGNGSGDLTVVWDAPENTAVENWMVNCMGTDGDNKTLIVSQTQADLTGLDTNKGYTITVTAEGMSTPSEPVYVSANPVAITNAQVTAGTDSLTVSWNCETDTEGSWLVIFQIPGQSVTEVAHANDTSPYSATLTGIVPNTLYNIEITLDSSITVLGGSLLHTTSQAPVFDGHALGYLVKDTPMEFDMCVRPETENWTHTQATNRTTVFTPGQKAGFVIHIPGQYNTVTNVIKRLFVIRDENGELVSYASTSEVWKNMWLKRYCELDIPQIPETPGNYTMEVYFNGYLAHTQSFTVAN